MVSRSLKSFMVGMLVGATALVQADVIVDDFGAGWAGRNKFNGVWIADSDTYVCNPAGQANPTRSNCGTSKVVDPVLGEDVVLNSANVAATYDGTGSIISKIKVSQDVAKTTMIANQNWAYAGWVMDFIPADTNGAGPEPWNQPQWERKNEIDISKCTHLELKMKFTPNRQLWIEVYNPFQEKLNPAAPAPQYGWRRYTSGTDMQTFRLALSGLGAPVQKWTGTPTDPKIDLTKVNRIKILYEGQTGSAVASPAPYDAVEHEFAIGGVSLIGADPACNIKGTAGIHASRLEGSGLTLTSASGALRFGNLAGLGKLNVKVRDLSGRVLAAGTVDASKPSMEVASLRNGVYAVQVTGEKLTRSFPVTLLH